MAYDIFSKYGLDKIHDSLTENYDYKDNNSTQWELVKKKEVHDSDGFLTDYSWYTNGEIHIFMFGDIDITEPDEDYADWSAETEEEAEEWFNSYTGFDIDEAYMDSDEDEYFDEQYTEHTDTDVDFMNSAFNRVYGEGTDLED